MGIYAEIMHSRKQIHKIVSIQKTWARDLKVKLVADLTIVGLVSRPDGGSMQPALYNYCLLLDICADICV